MDPNLLGVFMFIIVITAIVGASVNGIVQKSLDYKRAIRKADAPNSSAKLTEVTERTQMIEDRLAVLERIATDRGQMLADEINALQGSMLTDARDEPKQKEAN